MEFLRIAEVFFENGFVYSLLALGFYISYTILDFPDLSVEGTFLSGAVVFSLLSVAGVNPCISMICSMLVGMVAGFVTGFLHVVLKIRDLLCGILVSTALITVNLVVTVAGNGAGFSGDGLSVVQISRADPTLVRTFPFNLLPVNISGVKIASLVAFFAVVVVVKILLDAFLKTRRGMLLRATGTNARFTTMLARDPGKMKILGLSLGNGLAALSGSLVAQQNAGANQSMGIGVVIIGLASVIIGMSLFAKVRFFKDTTKVILGAVIYQACLSGAYALGVPTAYNKLIMAFLFTLALIFTSRKKTKEAGK